MRLQDGCTHKARISGKVASGQSTGSPTFPMSKLLNVNNLTLVAGVDRADECDLGTDEIGAMIAGELSRPSLCVRRVVWLLMVNRECMSFRVSRRAAL
jgi:hypothetical protein